MKKKTLLIAVMAIALAVVTAASVTVAWLTAESNQVTNTFTYGKIEIELNETSNHDSIEIKSDGIAFSHVVPGDKINKVPVVTVKEGSEACYVYVLVTNGLDGVATYDITTPWEVVAIGTNGKVLYRYGKSAVNALDAAQSLTVFTTVSFPTTLTATDVAALTGNITIKAYAHQADNSSMAESDANVKTYYGLN